MKIVIIGGSGLIGKKLAGLLTQGGHEVVAASPSTGVNTVTGEGLSEVLAGAEVVVDVSNSPSFEDGPVMDFFKSSTTHLLAAERAAGVRHHVALSVVGAERLPDSGYLRAKVAQEALIQAAAVPYTIVRATQFFEFLGAIAQGNTEGRTVRAPSAHLQPIAAADVVASLARVATAAPLNGRCEIAGPEAVPLDELLRRVLQASRDPREVVWDDNALYFGARLNDQSLTPGPQARIGATSLQGWLAGNVVAA